MMDMRIAENLRRLRKDRGVTQDELAGVLGISNQAVSKWECGNGLPDLPLLVSAAAYFGVSLDELVGMNELRDRTRREEMMDQAERLTARSQPEEAAALYREILALFPEDWQAMQKLAACLRQRRTDDPQERKKNAREALGLYERVAANCPDRTLAHSAETCAIYTLHQMGESEEAIRRAEAMDLSYTERYRILSHITEGGRKAAYCQQLIAASSVDTVNAIYKITTGEEYDRDEKIRLLWKIPALLGLLYDDGDFYRSYLLAAECCWRITHLQLKAGRVDEAFEALGECVRYAVSADRIDGEVWHTSPLFRRLSFWTGWKWEDEVRFSYSAHYSRAIRQMPEFDGVREDPRMEPILTLLDDTAAEVLSRVRSPAG